MAINRTPFNALIDDDGSGTTGSVWNKNAIAGVVLDPVDAAINPINAPSSSPHVIGGPLILDATSTGLIARSTADGSDTQALLLSGGGAFGAHRGGHLQLLGNDSGFGGLVALAPGTTAGSAIRLYRSDGSIALEVNGATGLAEVGYGLKFPATPVPSVDANTLDHYEEGAWTPSLIGAGGASGQTYAVRAGRYTKIGQQVVAVGNITLSTKGTFTDWLRLSGFPFTAGGVVNWPIQITGFSGNSTPWVWMGGYLYANQTTAELTRLTGAGSPAIFGPTEITDSFSCIFSCSYFTF